MKSKIRLVISMIIVSLFSTFAIEVVTIDNFQLLAEASQKEKNRIQIIGYGKTRGQAFIDAQKNAKKINYNYREISRSYSGSEGNWTCILIIEY